MNGLKQWIRSYKALTRPWVLVCSLLVFPGILLGLCCVCVSQLPMDATPFAILAMMCGSVILDGWVFGGIYMKGSGMFELMKASMAGEGLMKNGMRMDILRQLLVCGGIIGSVMGIQKYSMMQIGTVVGMVFDMVLLTLFCARHFGGLRMQLLFGYLGGIFTMVLFFVLIHLVYGRGISKAVQLGLLAMVWLMALGLIWLTDWYNRRCVANSFYDGNFKR